MDHGPIEGSTALLPRPWPRAPELKSLELGLDFGWLVRRRAAPPPTVSLLGIDAASGSDAGDGTASAPFATFAHAMARAEAGETVGLARGSVWRETLTTSVADLTIEPYGTGAIPVIDGADVMGAWTLRAGETDIWEQPWTRDGVQGGSDRDGLWIDGVRAPAHASLAALKSSGADGHWASSDAQANAKTLYLRSSVDPNADGRLYEATRRGYCVAAGHSQNKPGVPASIEGPFEMRRAYAHYNALHVGPGGSAERLLLRDGTIHHAVVDCARLRDVVMREHGDLPGVEASYLVNYRADGSGYDAVVERAFGFGLRPADPNATIFYAHGSTGPLGAAIRSMTWRQCAAVDTKGAFNAAAETILQEGCHTRSAAACAPLNAPQSTLRLGTLRDIRFRQGAFPVYDFGPADARQKVRVVEHCVFTGAEQLASVLRVDGRAGSLVVRNCLFFFERPPNALVQVAAATGQFLDVTFERNVIVRAGGVGGFKYTIDAGTGTGVSVASDRNVWIGSWTDLYGGQGIDMRLGGTTHRTLTGWQGETGNDANSRVFTADTVTAALAFFEGDPRSGDARLNAAALGPFADGSDIAATAGPQRHWDWNARAEAAGPPTAWPALPETLAEGRAYVEDPEAWAF